ncbi:MAG: hypothetical protein V3V16_08105 [Melioribacteraceae bacterium]
MLNNTKEIYDFDRVSRLSMILNYQLGTAALFVLTYAGGFTLWLATIAALIFLPYLLFILFKENRNGWIIAFAVVVVIPFLISFLISLKMGNNFFLIIALAFFYLYCFMLKYSVTDWIKEYNWKLVLDEQK